MKKKILFISEALWIGGIETALVNLLNRMDYEKYEVTLLLRRAIFDGDMRQKVPVRCRVLTLDREDPQYRFARLYHLTEESENPSLLHRTMMWAVPTIRWVENRLYIRYVREQMKHEHFDTCVIYSDVEGILAKGAELVPEEFPVDKFHIVSCGRVSHEKGMDLAVEACAELVAMGHENIHWWIIGGGPAEDAVWAKIAELHMEEYVTMLGMKANPYPYIKRANLYVQPSWFEGYPMTILEALILEQPVVSTNNTGAKEILHDGATGILCGISPQSVADKVHELLNNADVLENLRENVSKSDMDADNKQVLALLDELL